MLSKNQIKFIRSLQMKKFREIHHQFMAEGTKLVLDLLESSVPVKMIFATDEWIREHEGKIHAVPVPVTLEELSRITALATAPPVFALFGIQQPDLTPEALKSNLVLVLDEIHDPGNLGTILRIADWFGIRQIVCSENTVDLYNPKVVQATMGSIARISVLYTNIADWLSKIPEGIPVYGTSLDGENIYSQKLTRNGAIIIGSESSGISREARLFITNKLLIPSFSDGAHAESLNASVATAIVCSEFRRMNAV